MKSPDRDPARASIGKAVPVAIGLAFLVAVLLLQVRSVENRAFVPDAPRAGAKPKAGQPSPSGPSPARRTAPVAVSERADAGHLDRQAMNAWRTGDIRGAMALFEQAIAAAPDDAAPHSHYGRLLTLMVSYERAIPLLERARDLAPQDAQAWLDLATAYERAQRFDDAWSARAEAEKLVGADAVTRDERGRFVVVGNEL